MAVPYTFGTATAAIPLSNLDSNFATTITLGNTAIQLGNTVTTLNNMTLANVTVSSGSVTLTNITATTANVTTANISGTTTLTNLTASTALALDASKNIASVTNTGTGNNVLATSPTLVTPALGTPASGVLTNCTGLTQSGLAAGVAGNGPSFSAYANANQSLTTNVATKVILQLEEWDTASCFDNATNYRFTPTVAGYYKFDAMLRWACTGAASGVWLALYKNGSIYKRSFELGSLNSMQNGQILLSEMCSLNGSTDYVELYCLVAGTSPSLDGTSGSPYSSRFSGFLARSA
jgi:hypothetical protein